MCEYIILKDFNMDKYTYNENNGLWYELQGDYPILILSAEEEKPIGIWGQRHRRYLKEHKKMIYATLLTSGKLKATLQILTDRQRKCFFGLLSKWQRVRILLKS